MNRWFQYSGLAGASEALARQSGRLRSDFVALAIVLAAVVVRLTFLQSLGPNVAFVTFYPAVMLAALLGGLRSGAVATLASAVVADYLWVEPAGSLALANFEDRLAMSLFVGNGLLISWLASRLLRSQRRLRRAEAQRADAFERQVEERTAELVREVAERRRADANLLKATALLRAIGKNSPDPIYAKDAAGRFLYANPAVLAVIGKSEALVLGGTDADWHADPEQAAVVMANDQRIMESGVPEVIEETFEAAGLGERTFRSAKAPSLSSTMDRSPASCACRPTSPNCGQLKAEAEKSSQAKSKFLAAASHDLRQPVQALTLLLSVIKRQVADKPKTVEAALMAEAAVSSLTALLTSILDISKLDAGLVTPFLTAVDLGELVPRLAREHQPLAAAKGLSLRHACCPLFVRADREMLERILRNLLENALRYTDTGGVLLAVRRRGETARLDVIDTGIGIPADKHTEIFEEFCQLGNAAGNSSRGWGSASPSFPASPVSWGSRCRSLRSLDAARASRWFCRSIGRARPRRTPKRRSTTPADASS